VLVASIKSHRLLSASLAVISVIGFFLSVVSFWQDRRDAAATTAQVAVVDEKIQRLSSLLRTTEIHGKVQQLLESARAQLDFQFSSAQEANARLHELSRELDSAIAEIENQQTEKQKDLPQVISQEAPALTEIAHDMLSDSRIISRNSTGQSQNPPTPAHPDGKETEEESERYVEAERLNWTKPWTQPAESIPAKAFGERELGYWEAREMSRTDSKPVRFAGISPSEDVVTPLYERFTIRGIVNGDFSKADPGIRQFVVGVVRRYMEFCGSLPASAASLHAQGSLETYATFGLLLDRIKENPDVIIDTLAAHAASFVVSRHEADLLISAEGCGSSTAFSLLDAMSTWVSQASEEAAESYASAAGDFTLPISQRWLVIATRSTETEAVRLAHQYKETFPTTRVFLSSNGWYLITAGAINYADQGAKKDFWIKQNAIPADSFFSTGKNFTSELHY
jgi:hypothetical protein